jgi:Protein of Unknown function (DUF2784)
MSIQAYYAALADFIVAFHTLYVGFVVVGQLLILIGLVCRWEWVRNPWFRVIHLLCIAVVAAEAACNLTCPLTTWERSLRLLSGQSVNDSVVGWFFNSILFFNMPREFFTWIHIGFGALVLGTFLFGPPRFRRRKPAAVEETLTPSAARAAVCPIGPSSAAVRVERETGALV